MKLKLKDYDLGICLIDSEITDVHEKLNNPDTTSERRKELLAELGDLLGHQQTAIRNRNEYLSGLVPIWFTGLVGAAVSAGTSLFVFRKVFNLETVGEGVFGGQAVNIWDKVVRKF